MPQLNSQLLITHFSVFQSTNAVNVSCSVCPCRPDGSLREFALKHIKSHSQTDIHQRHLAMRSKNQTSISGFNRPSPDISVERARLSSPPLPIHESGIIDTDNSLDVHLTIEHDANENIAGPPILGSPSSGSLELPGPSDSISVPLSDLWAAISNSRYRSLGGELEQDVFEELQEALSAHAEIFSTPSLKSYPSVRRDFAHEEVDDQDDFGIEIPSMCFLRFHDYFHLTSQYRRRPSLICSDAIETNPRAFYLSVA